MPVSKFQDFEGVRYLMCACGCAKWWVTESEELICDQCGEARQDEDDEDEDEKWEALCSTCRWGYPVAWVGRPCVQKECAGVVEKADAACPQCRESYGRVRDASTRTGWRPCSCDLGRLTCAECGSRLGELTGKCLLCAEVVA